MDVQDSTFNRMSKDLRAQEYDLKKLSENEIHIKGIPTISSFMFFVLILIGTVLLVIGILSVTLKEPEWISGSLFMAAGLFLIFLPFQNYYSKKGLDIKIDKGKKQVEIRSFSIFRSKEVIGFDEIQNIILKKVKTNTFVDDTSESSIIQNYTVQLDLKNREDEILISFYRKDDESEVFTNYFTDYLADFIQKEKKSIDID